MFQVNLVSYVSGNLERRQGNENDSSKSNRHQDQNENAKNCSEFLITPLKRSFSSSDFRSFFRKGEMNKVEQVNFSTVFPQNLIN